MKHNVFYRKNRFGTANIKFLVCALFVAFCSCKASTNISENIDQTPFPQSSVLMSPSPVKIVNSKEIDYQGIRLINFIPDFSSVEASLKNASPLQNINDKPDYVEPKSIVLDFKKASDSKLSETDFPPQIRVFSVGEFRDSYALSKDYLKDFDLSLKTLKHFIAKTPVTRKDLPGLHFYDAHQTILARFKRVSFKNGKGIFYLTQYSQDCASIINNQGLTAIFQGLTDDGKYYLFGTFPVYLDGLPDQFTEKVGALDFSKDFMEYCAETKSPKKILYQNYLLSIERLLNSTSPGKFKPDLNLTEKTISSLEVSRSEKF